MSRPLRVGDRVTATGTVDDPHGDGDVLVRWDGYSAGQASWILPNALTLIAPAEPPVGSVVVKDGAAWTNMAEGCYSDPLGPWSDAEGNNVFWPDISDGDIIFTPGGEA